MHNNFSAFGIQKLQLITATRMKDVGPSISILSILTSISVYAPVRSGVASNNLHFPSYQNDDEDLSYYNFFLNLPSQYKNITQIKEFEDLEEKYERDNDWRNTRKSLFWGEVTQTSPLFYEDAGERFDDLGEDFEDEKDGLQDGRVWHSENLYRRRKNVDSNRYLQDFHWLDYTKPNVKRFLSHRNKKRVTRLNEKGDSREFPNQISKENVLKELENVEENRSGSKKVENSANEGVTRASNTEFVGTTSDLMDLLFKIDDERDKHDKKDEIDDKMKDKSSNNDDKIGEKSEKDDRSDEQRNTDTRNNEKNEKVNGQRNNEKNEESETNTQETVGDGKENDDKKKHEEEKKKVDKANESGEKQGDKAESTRKNIKSEEKKDGDGKDTKNEVPKENQKDGCNAVPVKPDIITGQLYSTIINEPYSTVTDFWNKALEQRFQGGFETARTLKVIVIPFSHNDAAWLRTFDEYYFEKSRKILDNLTRELLKYKDMTFVWSEICFLSRWWKSASRQLREDFLDLVRTNRIEICPGGWVMPDEACPHLFALLVQLTEGHMWVKDNLGVLPKVGWSIDPFGHSSTLAYMMQEAGLTQGNVIQRVHFGWKSYLAKRKAGDFVWKQAWDDQNTHGLLTHHLPFNIYSASVSCGPHAEVCRQFDFNLSSATTVTYGNVKARTELLLSEYWRTGSLFPHNVVMVPLGDDFRYTNPQEFAAQYRNYKAIMDYGNSDKKLRTEISFGTPSDYFKIASRRLCKFPILQGDFFPYADYDEKGAAYWTGYYSTRPHHKKLTRIAEWNLRSAEILFTLALNIARQNRVEHDNLRRLFQNLINSRRQLSLFQHHDGITGTSKAYVMEDFRNRLIESNTNSILVQSGAIQYIFGSATPDPVEYSPTNLTPLTIIIKEQDLSSSMFTRIIPGSPQKIVVFNPLGSKRQDVLRIIVSNPCVDIKDISTGKMAPYQVNPVWYIHEYALYQPIHFSRVYVKKTEFELVIVLDLEPLALKVYEISEFSDKKCCFVKTLIEKAEKEEEDGKTEDGEGVSIPANFHRPPHFASVYSLTKASVDTYGIFTSKTIQVDWLILENDDIVVNIDQSSGFITTIKRKDTNETFKVDLNYHGYHGEEGRSGAYIFKTTGNQTSPDCTDIEFMVIHGPILTETILIFHGSSQHTTRIFHVSGPLSQAVQVETMVNLATAEINENTELFLKLKTDIKNGNPPVFYSDSNGFQTQRRQKVCGAGIESNFYPSTTCVYIEDEKTRLSVLTEQSHGVSSNHQGQIEMMMDRRLHNDDGRGMGEGVLDTRKAIFSFFLLLEQFKTPSDGRSKISLLAHALIDMQTYPINVFYWKPYYPVTCPPKFNALLNQGLPCDLRIVNLRTYSHPNTENYPLNSALMTIHRRAFRNDEYGVLKRSCSLGPRKNESAAFLEGTRFKHLEVEKILRVSLTGLYEGLAVDCLNQIVVDSYEMKSVRIDFK
ncbi:alpha-mannosidase 2 [Nilaparvata lugens]|uniref:alpha-mannosidase 2 n=1 Tax=Nilaparvata lugens TaxID=108931 RepID=UPI00193D071C|nr:alpha-mannosidase 2 [Nilaparvata lugens]